MNMNWSAVIDEEEEGLDVSPEMIKKSTSKLQIKLMSNAKEYNPAQGNNSTAKKDAVFEEILKNLNEEESKENKLPIFLRKSPSLRKKKIAASP